VFNRDLSDSAARVVDVELFDEAGAVIIVDGDLDLATGWQLEAAIIEQVGNGHRHLLIDLSRATFLDSSAIGVLLRSLAPLRNEPSAAVALVNAQGIVRRALGVSGVGAMFSSFETRDRAIAAVTDATKPLRDGWRQVQERNYPH